MAFLVTLLFMSGLSVVVKHQLVPHWHHAARPSLELRLDSDEDNEHIQVGYVPPRNLQLVQCIGTKCLLYSCWIVGPKIGHAVCIVLYTCYRGFLTSAGYRPCGLKCALKWAAVAFTM
jgi:hypothetical protein